MGPTLGGVHKIQILIRDLLKDFLHKIFGEEMGGVQGDPDPLIKKLLYEKLRPGFFGCSSLFFGFPY